MPCDEQDGVLSTSNPDPTSRRQRELQSAMNTTCRHCRQPIMLLPWEARQVVYDAIDSFCPQYDR